MPCNKAFLLLFVLLLVSSQSGIITHAFNHGNDPMDPLEDSAKKTKSRKLLEEIVQLDYDYAGPNPKHNPRRGGSSRNP